MRSKVFCTCSGGGAPGGSARAWKPLCVRCTRASCETIESSTRHASTWRSSMMSATPRWYSTLSLHEKTLAHGAASSNGSTTMPKPLGSESTETAAAWSPVRHSSRDLAQSAKYARSTRRRDGSVAARRDDGLGAEASSKRIARALEADHAWRPRSEASTRRSSSRLRLVPAADDAPARNWQNDWNWYTNSCRMSKTHWAGSVGGGSRAPVPRSSVASSSRSSSSARKSSKSVA
mmetsp:Transcript_4589/g.18681  ORF Transcript_4589/g.18681 Transcript_4589/m.18681 type:complete len:234 (-) Transcript_4589:378-1079(-)